MRIIVKRGKGDKPAPDVTDPLLSTADAQLLRGKAELWGAMDRYAHTLELPFQGSTLTGEVVELHRLLTGESYRCRITGVQITAEGATIQQRLTIERPA